jgi:predicted small metal-binding protein
MIQRIFSSFFVAMIVLALTTVTFAQEMKKEEPKKEAQTEMKSTDMKSADMSKTEMGPLKSVSCDDACGFMIRSRSEKEVISATKAHFKHIHKKDVTDKQVKEMMKTEGAEMHK